MVLADLGRRIRNAIGSLGQATIINEDVSSKMYIFNLGNVVSVCFYFRS